MVRTSEFGSENDGSTPSSSDSGPAILGTVDRCIYCRQLMCTNNCFSNVIEFQEALEANQIKVKTKYNKKYDIDMKTSAYITGFKIGNPETGHTYEGIPTVVSVIHKEEEKIVEVKYQAICKADNYETNFIITHVILHVNSMIVSDQVVSPIRKSEQFDLSLEWKIEFEYGGTHHFQSVDDIKENYNIEVSR